MELPMTAPEKPAFGATCNGCGYCCAAAVCEVGLAVFGPEAAAPCPGMAFHDGRFWCGVVENCPPHLLPFLRFRMGIGAGCDSDVPAAGVLPAKGAGR